MTRMRLPNRASPLAPVAAALVLATASGCKKAPPTAPTELSELAGFLFEHFGDEDPAELEAGIVNLDAWLVQHIQDTLDGFSVDDLSESVIDSVDPGREHDLEKLGGAAVAHISGFGVDPIAEALVLHEQEEVFPDAYDVHDRTYLTDPDCFPTHACEMVTTDNVVEASYPLGLKTTTHSRSEYRWIAFDEGWAFLHRTWLTEPADVNFDWIDVHEQLYVGATLKWGDGAVRLGTTWIAADVLDGVVSEDTALNVMIDSMQAEGENLDAYLGGEDR